MWFKNKKTGVKWEITSKDLLDRLSKSKDFEVIPEPKEKVVVEVKEENMDYNSLSFQKLRKVAKEKDINTYKMNKEDIIKALEDLEG